MRDVIIFGAGGLGRMVKDIMHQAGRHRPVAFLDSDPAKRGTTIDNLPVAGDLDDLDRVTRHGVQAAIVAIGDNPVRLDIAQELCCRGVELVSAVHPLASVSPSARLAEHLIVGPRVSICAHARIGPHTVLSAGSIVEHDNVLGAALFVHSAVRLAGGVFVDDLATLGIGACVIQNRRIGRRAHVEPGAVVIADVEPDATVGGVPAIVCGTAPRRRVAPRLPAHYHQFA